MLDRVARLTGALCLIAQGTRLGGVAFYHVNGTCRVSWLTELSAKIWWREVNIFLSYHLLVLSAEQNDSQSEEINVIDESQAP